MRHLLNTLYVMTEDTYLANEGENVTILKDKEIIARYPLHGLDSIIVFNYKGVSPALMGMCVEKQINLCFMTPGGQFLARITGKSFGNVLLRKKQYRLAEGSEEALQISKNMLVGKLYNARWILLRTVRDHALVVDIEKIRKTTNRIQISIKQIESATEHDQLRGIEGDAASEYFGVFNEMILNPDEAFVFHGRSRRPPLDCVNAMMSFAYTLLANNCASALESVGLDSYVGFMHTDKPGRMSLALDLMEELRPVIADRFVLYCINNRVVNASMFENSESGGVFLNEKGRKTFLKTWQERKKETLTHPFLKEKTTWGLVPYLQALLLARYLRGDTDQYPPFLWK